MFLFTPGSVVYTRVGEGVWGETLKMFLSSLYFRNRNLYFFQRKYRSYLIIYISRKEDAVQIWIHINEQWINIQISNLENYGSLMETINPCSQFLICFESEWDSNKTFILDSHRPYLCSVCCPPSRVSSKQTKINFGSNRNKPKQDLFWVCFGLFRETKDKKFRFVSVFQIYIDTTETNRTVS